MKLNIVMCDDDSVALNAEHELIASVFSDRGIDCSYDKFTDPDRLLSSDISYDIAFLDIEMEGTDGLTAAKKLMEKNKDCIIFFITNYSVYLDRAFDVRAFRYLPKPLDRARLESGIDSALERIRDRVRSIRLTNYKNKVEADIAVASIIFIETDGRHTHVVTTEHDFIAEEHFKTIKDMIEKEVTYFAQSHQSYLVNMRYVTYYDRLSVILSYGGKKYKAEMSRRQYNSFDEKFFKQAGELR